MKTTLESGFGEEWGAPNSEIRAREKAPCEDSAARAVVAIVDVLSVEVISVWGGGAVAVTELAQPMRLGRRVNVNKGSEEQQ